ncbi:MAG: nitrile hydratase accessory protein [Candidatus Puniceispirillum sp.]|nr:nitrile hydratase accessory protein [Candidatus Puniceispirillum sp.]
MNEQLPKDPKSQMMKKGKTGAAAMPLSPEKVFDAPWHAEVFALAVHLNEGGYFDWPEWAGRFGENLAAVKTVKIGVGEGLDGSDDYYQIWLQTLIELMQEKGLVDAKMLASIKAQWREAYLTTLHGEPVHL